MVVLHTVIIRYSLLLEDHKAWVIARTDLDTYKNTLFNDKRLKLRFELFKNLTLPSLAQQKLIQERLEGTDTHKLQVFLATSQQLPEKYKQKLDELAREFRWLNICYLPSSGVGLETVATDYIERLFSNIEKPILYSSIRLDDDDILSVDFLNRLETYVTKENIGRAITFANGYYGVYSSEKNSFTKTSDIFYPKLALGLAFVNKYDKNGYSNKIKTIYGAGNHSLIDRRVPVITDGKKPSYIRTLHIHADSHDENKLSRSLKKNNLIHPIKVMQTIGMSFPVSFDGLILDIDINEAKKINIYRFNLTKNIRGFDFFIEMCFWKNNVLIQICKYDLEEQLTFTLRKNDTVLAEDFTMNSTKLQKVIHLEGVALNCPSKISEAVIDAQETKSHESSELLFLDVSVYIKDAFYKSTFRIE